MNNQIEHPNHYGGEDNVYEAIKVIQAWNLGFELGNVLKYISRNGKKEGEAAIKDLKKAKQYLEFEIAKLEKPMKPEHEQELIDSVKEAARIVSGPTFEDFLKAKKVRVVYDTKSPEYDGTIQNVIQHTFGNAIKFPDTEYRIAYLNKRDYEGNGVFKDEILLNREVKLEIIE